MAEKQTDIPEAVPERTKLPQPKRVITPPGSKDEPDTSQNVGRSRTVETVNDEGVRMRGEVPPAQWNADVASQLAAGAEANDMPLPPSNMTTTASLSGGVQPRFTDPRSQAPPPIKPLADNRTKIQIGPISEAIVSEEPNVRVKPKFTGSRFIGPYRYYFTKNVACEVPKSVRDALLREDLVYAFYE